MLSARCRYFGRPQPVGCPIQKRIDEFVALLSAENAAQLDGLVDDHAVRHVLPMGELIDADQEDGVLHRVELGDRPIRELGDTRVQILVMFDTFPDEFPEKLVVRPLVLRVVRELEDNVLGGLTGQLPLV